MRLGTVEDDQEVDDSRDTAQNADDQFESTNSTNLPSKQPRRCHLLAHESDGGLGQYSRLKSVHSDPDFRDES